MTEEEQDSPAFSVDNRADGQGDEAIRGEDGVEGLEGAASQGCRQMGSKQQGVRRGRQRHGYG